MKKIEVTLVLLNDECKVLLPQLKTLGVDIEAVEDSLELLDTMPLDMAAHKLVIARSTRKALHKLVKQTTKHKRFTLAKRTLASLADRVEKIKHLAIDIEHHH